MNNILKQIALLYEQELYTNVVQLAELAVSLADQKQDMNLPFAKFQFYVYYAEALFNLQQYLQAENVYVQALQIRKYIIKTKNTKLPDAEKEIINDIDIRYKLHLCYLKLDQTQRATEILQIIPARSRTPKINMSLGNLYRDGGLERSAIACYKEVLRECPLSLEAAENLLKLGVEGAEVNSLTLKATGEVGWLNAWLKAQAQMHARDYANAVNTFLNLDTYGNLKDNSSILVSTAYCYNYMCDDKKALACLQRAVHLDPRLITGRDLLASLLANSTDKDHYRELERLQISDFDMSLWACEHWVAMGYCMYANKKYERAIYFGQQACLQNRRSVEALLLKAATFMQINKYTEASLHYREVLQYCPNRFDAHKGLVESYMAMNRLREATTVANNACKQMNNISPVLTVYASVLVRDPVNVTRAKSLLERAIATDPTYIPAVCLLAEQLDHEQAYEQAVALLSRHVEQKPCSRLHQLMADCFVHLQKDDEAFEHYNIALRLDPNNQRALEGMNNIGRSQSCSKLDSTYYMSAVGECSTYASQAPSNSDHEPDPDSDTDQWLNRDLMAFE